MPKILWLQVPLAARFKALFPGRSTAEIVGSNPNWGIGICLFFVCCVLSGTVLCDENDHSSKGVLQTVVRTCVWYRDYVYEEALAHLGGVLRKNVVQLIV